MRSGCELHGLGVDLLDGDEVHPSVGEDGVPVLLRDVLQRPSDLPADYYSRLRGTRTLPMLVCEGGWASQPIATVATSQQVQADYIDRHATLLDSVGAVACLQLQFTDIDITSVPAPVPANLPLFVSIGLADTQFGPKPALSRWDALHSRPRA